MQLHRSRILLPFGFVFHPQEVEQLSSLSEELSRMELQQWLFESLFDTKEQLVTEYQPQYEVNLSVEHGEKWELTPHLENGRAIFIMRSMCRGRKRSTLIALMSCTIICMRLSTIPSMSLWMETDRAGLSFSEQ